MVGKYFAPIHPKPQILATARNQNRYHKKAKSLEPKSPRLSSIEKSPMDYRLFFLSRLAAFFSAAVLRGAFLVCFFEFWDLAITHPVVLHATKRGRIPQNNSFFSSKNVAFWLGPTLANPSPNYPSMILRLLRRGLTLVLILLTLQSRVAETVVPADWKNID